MMRLEWHDFAELRAGLLYDVLQFRQAVFVVEQRCAYPDLDGCDDRAHHLILRADRMLAGYLRLVPSADEERIAIGRVAVAAPARGRGLGRLLMHEALARCRRDHPESAVTLSAQAYLVRFYESFGFRPVSEPFDDYGVPHIEMRLAGP